MWTPEPSKPQIPPPDPKKPWALNHNDRWFLRGLKIDPENPPYPLDDDEDE